MTTPNKILLLVTIALVLLIAGCAGCYLALFSPLSKKGEDTYIYIDRDDTKDSVLHKISIAAESKNTTLLNILMQQADYKNDIKTGRYVITPQTTTWKLFQNLRYGTQTPIRLTITTARTTKQLASKLSKKLLADSTEIASALCDSTFCTEFKHTPATIIGLFLPNTYEVYWDISVDNLTKRMEKESKAFWNEKRLKQAEEIGLSINEIITLASIINQETRNTEEKPIIAGLYINRLRKGMKLQACPTAKYASGNFLARRVTKDIISTDSPYNTYKYEGLPPGPICIPMLADIDAVLNHKRHNYLFMCAKEDFSGTHNFATNGAEHLRNARRYAIALNKRGIKK